jgi:hypothetical protein
MCTAEDCDIGEEESCGMSCDGRGGKESGLRDMGVFVHRQASRSMVGNVKVVDP